MRILPVTLLVASILQMQRDMEAKEDNALNAGGPPPQPPSPTHSDRLEPKDDNWLLFPVPQIALQCLVCSTATAGDCVCIKNISVGVCMGVCAFVCEMGGGLKGGVKRSGLKGRHGRKKETKTRRRIENVRGRWRSCTAQMIV